MVVLEQLCFAAVGKTGARKGWDSAAAAEGRSSAARTKQRPRKSCAATERAAGNGTASLVIHSLYTAWAGFVHAGLPVAISMTVMASDHMSAFFP